MLAARTLGRHLLQAALVPTLVPLAILVALGLWQYGRASDRIPWNLNGQLANYVAAVDALKAANGLPPGPDLYGWFKAHPEELRSDRVHPTAAGERRIQRLWGEAAASVY